MNEEWMDYYIFLNVLRDSGVTNMFGAGSYLVEHFDEITSSRQATKIVSSWMQNFEKIQERLA